MWDSVCSVLLFLHFFPPVLLVFGFKAWLKVASLSTSIQMCDYPPQDFDLKLYSTVIQIIWFAASVGAFRLQQTAIFKCFKRKDCQNKKIYVNSFE